MDVGSPRLMPGRDELLACLTSERWADQVLSAGPYPGTVALAMAADRAFRFGLADDDVRAALGDHPAIGAQPTHASAASRAEQASTGDAGADVEAELATLNREYAGRFGHVFLIRARGRSKAQILDELRQRITRPAEQEWHATVQQLREITALRVVALGERMFGGVGSAPGVRSLVSSHVLDAVAGRPAVGVGVQLWLGDVLLAAERTDDDGRVASLGPAVLQEGDYDVRFATGRYFAERATRSLYPEVTVRFSARAGERHYHIPLLLTPNSYTTYRGS